MPFPISKLNCELSNWLHGERKYIKVAVCELEAANTWVKLYLGSLCRIIEAKDKKAPCLV